MPDYSKKHFYIRYPILIPNGYRKKECQFLWWKLLQKIVTLEYLQLTDWPVQFELLYEMWITNITPLRYQLPPQGSHYFNARQAGYCKYSRWSTFHSLIAQPSVRTRTMLVLPSSCGIILFLCYSQLKRIIIQFLMQISLSLIRTFLAISTHNNRKIPHLSMPRVNISETCNFQRNRKNAATQRWLVKFASAAKLISKNGRDIQCFLHIVQAGKRTRDGNAIFAFLYESIWMLWYIKIFEKHWNTARIAVSIIV